MFVTIQVKSSSPNSDSKVQVQFNVFKSILKDLNLFCYSVKIRNFYSKSSFQNSVQDCDKIESNSSSNLMTKFCLNTHLERTEIRVDREDVD